jgi:2-oxoglutarate ferredoxin oxidoreductase subunit alpha
MSIDFNTLIGGEAGQGVQSIGFLLAKAFSKGGYSVFADQDYESRIRGGHNFFRVRIKDTEVNAISEELNLLVALNEESLRLHASEVEKKGIILLDSNEIANRYNDSRYLAVPFTKFAEEKVGSKVTANTIALGVILGLVGYDSELMVQVIREYFRDISIVEDNIKAAILGFDYAQQNFSIDNLPRISPIRTVKRMLLNGNEAIALGAMAAECKFVASYPMTPATTITEYLASNADKSGMVVVQPEDEIAAINMVIGAAFTGVRAMTATSGSGFCLMVEGLGLAGITETPIVIVDGQRPGPAVGLPTRTEQGDLLFAIHAHHGDFPRAVLAPATVEDAFWIMVKAFNLAEKYQIPVIVLTDHHLASSYCTVNTFDLSQVLIDRGILYSAERDGSPHIYKRHRITETGISPRAFPGTDELLVVTDSDEHDEEGHLTESASIRTEQMRKRLRKIISLKQDISLPKLYGPRDAETMLIGWGSTFGAMREAVALMLEDGASINMLHLNELWPFPDDFVAKAIDQVSHSFVVEGNATGQLARLIRAETGKKIDDRILKFDGRPLTPEIIMTELKGVY